MTLVPLTTTRTSGLRKPGCRTWLWLGVLLSACTDRAPPARWQQPEPPSLAHPLEERGSTGEDGATKSDSARPGVETGGEAQPSDTDVSDEDG